MSRVRANACRLIALAVGLSAGSFSSAFAAPPQITPQTSPQPATAESAAALSHLDPSTRLLVETELRNATPQERTHWLSILRNVQSDQVPYLLQARRRAGTGRPAATTTQPNTVVPKIDTPVGSAVRTTSTPTPINGPHSGPYSNDAPSERLPIERTAFEPPGVPSPSPRGMELPSAPPQSEPPALSPNNGEPAEPEESAFRRALMTPLRPFRGEPARNEPTPPATASLTPPTPPNQPAPTPEVPATTPPRRAPDAATSPFVDAELHRLISLLEAEAAQAPPVSNGTEDRSHLRRHLQLRLLRLMVGEPERALDVIPGIPPAEQEMWTHLLWAIANESEVATDRSPAERAARTADLLAEAERQLRGTAVLQIAPACFCHKINSFGSYERFVRDEFRPGQPVLVYAELRNFASELTSDGQYRTRLRTVVEIHSIDENDHRDVIERRDFPVTQDVCRSPRLDYFHSYRLDLPATLPAGRYILRLMLTDELSSKSGTAEIAFAIR